jgi:DNA-binding transcriptional ArsR family regulator
VGDFVLTDPRAMRALAEPSRLALLDRLRRAGPATASELSAQTGELEELERFGFVERVEVAGESGWKAVAKGFVFEIPDDPEGQAAARRLSNVMMERYVDLPRSWIADDEPRLELDWARAAGLFNARVTVTPDELRGLQDGLERLLEPFITREADAAPAGARPARLLAYFLPEA